MKKKFSKRLFLTCAAVAAMFVGVETTSAINPPSKTGATPVSGTAYYIYNIGAGMYMNHGSRWGTHVTVDGAGCQITLGSSGDYFTLHHAGIADKKYQTEDGWSDNTAAGKFSFETATADGYSNVYYIKGSGGNYYYWAGGGSGMNGDEALTGATPETFTNAYKWILVPATDREVLTSGNDVTHKITNPDFTAGTKDSGWSTGWSVTTYGSQSGNEAFSGIFAEVYKYSGTPDINQTISLDAGYYMLSAKTNSRYAISTLYAKNGDTSLATLAVGDGTSTDNIKVRSLTFSLSETTDVTIGYSAAENSTKTRWSAVDDFRLTYYKSEESYCTIHATEAIAASEAKVSEESAMDAAVLQTLKEKKTAVKAATTKEDLETAIAELETATDAAVASVRVYKQGTDINALINAGTAPVDVTSAVNDADGSTATSWSCTNSQEFRVNTWSTEGNTDGTGMTTPFIQNWSNSALGDATIAHSIIPNLTAGYYQVTVLARAYMGSEGTISGVTFNVNDASVDLKDTGKSCEYASSSLYGVYGTYKAVVEIESNGSLNINFGIKSTNATWLAFKNLTVTYLGADLTAGTQTTSIADNGYIQGGETVTLTFKDASDSYTLTEGAEATWNDGTTDTKLTLTSIDGSASVTLPTGLTASSTGKYKLSIPADVLTGNALSTKNTAVTLNLNTPAVFDGIYYVKAADGRYLSRGDNYNTCAIVDNYGVAVKVATSAANITTFTFVDSNKQLFDADNGTVYTDNTNYPNWSVAKVEGGFKIINQNDLGTKGNALWIETNTDTNYKYDRLVTTNGGTAEVFTFEATADHPTAMTAVKNAQAAAVAKALDSKTTITTKADFDTFVGKLPYSDVEITTPVSDGAELYQGTGDITETLSNIPNGLYKVSVYAYQRNTFYSEDLATKGYDAPTTTLYANDQEVNICSPFNQIKTSSTAWSENNPADVVYSGCYYPNNTTSGSAAITAGNYLNEIYVLVTDNTLKFGLYKGNKIGNGDWVYYKNFSVTYYGEKRTTTKDKYGTICLPYALEATGATLYSAAINENYVKLSEITTPVAGTPYIYQATADAQTFAYTSGAVVSDPVAAAPLVGVLTETTVAAGNYVLQTQTEGQKFYKVQNSITLSANKAYLTTSSETKSLSIGFDDDPTAINSVDAVNALLNGDAKIYDLSGRKLNSLQKGVNIVNGVKVIVK